MVEYEFQCPKCHRVFTALRDPLRDKVAYCECGARGDRVFSAAIGHIDWVNGGFHGDEPNLGLGKHFKSAREREYYAASKGLTKDR